jgi:hypothetical protein
MHQSAEVQGDQTCPRFFCSHPQHFHAGVTAMHVNAQLSSIHNSQVKAVPWIHVWLKDAHPVITVHIRRVGPWEKPGQIWKNWRSWSQRILGSCVSKACSRRLWVLKNVMPCFSLHGHWGRRGWRKVIRRPILTLSGWYLELISLLL